MTPTFTGPLRGLRVVEIGSYGPGPFGAMLLADLGADVVRVDRAAGASLVSPNDDFRTELLHRGRRSVAVDLKHPAGREVVWALVERADALLEGFRPGVAERLGIGPDDCRARNPTLVYGRISGYGQDGPLAARAGHDINFIAQSGLLSAIGRAGAPPTPPLAVAGDFVGGLTLALGVLAALLETRNSGLGQIIDAAMVDSSALLAAPFLGYLQTGDWHRERGRNLVDSGAPYYDAYLCADGRYLAVGAMEPKFYAELLRVLELDPAILPDQNDEEHWPELKAIFAARIATRPRQEWLAAAGDRDACLSPVLELDEAARHPHAVARNSYSTIAGLVQPVPAPRFSRTPAAVDRPSPAPGAHSREVLTDWQIDASRIAAWFDGGAVKEGGTG